MGAGPSEQMGNQDEISKTYFCPDLKKKSCEFFMHSSFVYITREVCTNIESPYVNGMICCIYSHFKAFESKGQGFSLAADQSLTTTNVR